MKFKFDHDLHIHSYLSLCSKEPTQTTANLLKYAEETGLKKLCITDHFWDEDVQFSDESVPSVYDFYKIQNFEYISQNLPLPESDNMEFCFGCETDLDKHFTLGISPSCFDKFSFVVIPTTHMHMRGFTISDSDIESNERRAELWVDRLEAVLNMDLPFHKIGIAHLVCGTIAKRDDLLKILSLIPTEKMVTLFTKAAKLGVGIELNYGDMNFKDEEADIILRPFRVAKSCGCKFYCGSDSHRFPNGSEFRRVFERAIDMLGLEETDKISFLR
ncbi:MAG: hypothetical protein E7481_08100 [Ruminococcaceae bacterium]|nr:hypothetical protein [Oscillospiraceae bacterium]